MTPSCPWRLVGSRLSGAITNYTLPDGTTVVGITVDRHGNLWFADNFTDPNSYATKEAIGRITPQGRIRMFAVPFPKDAQSPELDAIATGPDGNVYFTADYRGQNNNKDHSFFGQITARGHIRLTALSVSTSSSTYPSDGSYADDVTSLISGPNGKLWFASETGKTPGIARISTSGKLGQFVPVDIYSNLTNGSNGQVWLFGSENMSSNTLATVTRSGIVATRDLPSPNNTLLQLF